MDETSELTDMRDMIAVHDAFRAEFSALPGMVLAVDEGDTVRAAVVGRHAILMLRVLHGHHGGEDALVWPVMKERAPEAADLIATLQSQHARMDPLLDGAQDLAEAWMASADAATGADLAAQLEELHSVVAEHLALEESQFLPIGARHLSREEWMAVGAHSRASLSQEDLALALGTILADTTPELGELIIGSMPPEAQAGWNQFGRPMYDGYRATLYAAA
jgi:hypothetical protein